MHSSRQSAKRDAHGTHQATPASTSAIGHWVAPAAAAGWTGRDGSGQGVGPAMPRPLSEERGRAPLLAALLSSGADPMPAPPTLV